MNKLRIYGASFCSYCHKAIELLQSKGYEEGKDFEYIDIGESVEHQEFIKSQGHRTIPQIYELDEQEDQLKRHIGGYTNLVEELSA